ncbi:Aspartate aminotransferase, cytoplasmic [Steccherinum ochraceum]|uniref:Aspartate aminotransferase n=1 Tax=Steccherinum ochraceum TaxID=92696 RepID=A0A4R0R942_9APHY|nr:Aspartate aminotransferase, cytoplasmic [Steccherinum ochraceum]
MANRVRQVLTHLAGPSPSNTNEKKKMSESVHGGEHDFLGLGWEIAENLIMGNAQKLGMALRPLPQIGHIFQLTASYKADPFPQKINLGVGAYRDDDNKPWVLPVVKKATNILVNDPAVDHEYLPITGLPQFTSAAAKLILGKDSPAIAEERVSSVQTISGTGANHLGALFLSRFYAFPRDGGREKTVYLSNPTWANHRAIFNNVGIQHVDYQYWDPKTNGLAFKELLDTLNTAPDRSVFLLHPCAHNPTGVDPTQAQWEQISDVLLKKHHYAFLDCAYQGFASGDLDKDAWAVRRFVEKGVPMLVCQSFAKNAGLYGERVGALHIVAPTKEAADKVKSQLSILSRSEISNPPAHGARLVALILNDPALFEQWKDDIRTMANRIIAMRKELHRLLTEELKTPGNWDHIVNQIGMFSFTGINSEASKALTEQAHVYLTTNGRISMAGLNTKNIRYFAENLDKVVRAQEAQTLQKL